MLEIRVRVGPKGQVVIPQVFRKALKIAPKSEVIFKLEGNRIIIKKPRKDVIKTFEMIAKSRPRFTRKMHPHEAYEEKLAARLG